MANEKLKVKAIARISVIAFLSAIGSICTLSAQELSEAEVIALMDHSLSLLNERDYKEALTGFLAVSRQTQDQSTETEHSVYVCSQTMAVICYTHLGQYKEAYNLAGRVLLDNLSERQRSDLLTPYVFCGYTAAIDNIKTNRYSEARELFESILPYADSVYRRRIIHYRGVSWYYEGMNHQIDQSYVPALSCYKAALSDFCKVQARDFQMQTHCRIGEINKNLSLWRESLPAYLEADKLTESLNSDEERMEILSELVQLYDVLGDSESAERVNSQMDSLYSVTGSVSAKFVYQDFKGEQASLNKQYTMSERWYMRNAPILPELKDPAKYHRHYLHLRNLYSRTGNWEDAIRYAQMEKVEKQRGYTPSDAEYYSPYGFIADVYYKKRDSINCFHYLDSLFLALPLTKEPRNIKHLYVSRALAYAGFGNYDRAMSDYRSADSILATKYGPDDADRVSLLPLMGGAEAHLKNYQKAERLYREYAGHIRSINGENSSDYIDALDYLANAEGYADHIEAATRDYKEAADLLKRKTRTNWPYLTSSEREGYWASSATLLNNMTPFALKAKEVQAPFTEASYNGLIFTKGFLLESEQSTFDLVKQNGSKEDLETFSRIQALGEQVRVWERYGHEYADSILTATSAINRLEIALARRCRAYGDVTSFMEIDYGKVKEALGNDDVLLDFTDFVPHSRGRIYAAYIVNKEQRYPLLKELFPERIIDSLGITYPYQYYSGENGKCICDLLWKPLEKYVKKGATVYYVPTQMLFQIAPESIPVGDGTLLGDHYHFVRLSSARELVRYNARLQVSSRTGHQNAVLYGGLQYSLDGPVMAEEARKYDVPRMLAFRGNDELVRGDSLFYDLPGSKQEIEAIGQALNSRHLSVLPYTGKDGTEESFLSMSGKAPEILHLATHGFYYTPDAAQKVEYLRGFTDAMSLSGLVLAGGNAAWLGQELPEGVLGGILTAADIARMDLSGVEMVVLSACHSGTGEATPEGLYGLQRAFKKAGAKTIVMSLWAESDAVGPEFMTAFYKSLVGDSKHEKRKAFDAAKNDIRKKYPDMPSLWAGFVMLD